MRFLVFELWSILYMGDFHVFDSLFIKIDHIQNLPYLKKLKVEQKKISDQKSVPEQCASFLYIWPHMNELFFGR